MCAEELQAQIDLRERKRERHMKTSVCNLTPEEWTSSKGPNEVVRQVQGFTLVVFPGEMGSLEHMYSTWLVASSQQQTFLPFIQILTVDGMMSGLYFEFCSLW